MGVRQWGLVTIISQNDVGTTIFYNLTFLNEVYAICATDGGNACYSWGAQRRDLNTCQLWAKNIGNYTQAQGFWIAIGK